MAKLKYYQIALEGIDKTGKDTIREYIYFLGKAKYICRTRGLISNMAYNILFNRNYDYDIEAQQDVVYVYLTADKEDLDIRYKMTNENKIDYDSHLKVFETICNDFKSRGKIILTFNTSKMTPYAIAKAIIFKMEELNHE